MAIAESIRFAAGMSRAEFHDYWERVHGPLVMSIADIRRHELVTDVGRSAREQQSLFGRVDRRIAIPGDWEL